MVDQVRNNSSDVRPMDAAGVNLFSLCLEGLVWFLVLVCASAAAKKREILKNMKAQLSSKRKDGSSLQIYFGMDKTGPLFLLQVVVSPSIL